VDSNTDTYTKTFSIDIERTNYHLKCRQRKRKRIITVFILWIIIFVYFVTPLSKVNLKLSGNVYYTKQEVMNMAYISKNDFWWLVDTKKVKKVLESYEHINSVNVSKSFLGIEVKIDEVYPIATKDNKYVMSDKQIIEKSEYQLDSKVDILTSFDCIEEENISRIVNEYKDVSLAVRNHFNKIEIVQSEIGNNEFYDYVKLYGKDERIGYFIIKVDLIYLSTKFNHNKYSKIILEVSKNNVKYDEGNPALIAYHYLNEEQFQLVENFEEE
jgi:hypothetical protein